uniref:GB1/RHD3-type G domain-containing protein n=1 Tax=Neobodo designis TaxID=312471 RepID=A0A7S1M7N2_NEODS|mmetsp:Transcript_3539/g.11011  ORF Transcript_3539/g.11011 Transcript_3539/m.11011 type:complete len:847 (+) Transcript_3539:159-2699(+)
MASNGNAGKWLHLIDGNGDLVHPAAIARYLGQCLGADPKTLPRVADIVAAEQDSDSPVVIPSVPVLKKRAFDYRMVGVFGGQSSGKSTLLNHLFATDFAVMDADEGRSQTTKGCFLSKARCPEATASESGQGLFIMDFEGTDGVERGENQNFEKQLSLFALSVADTLIINMWCNEVGRFNAANLSLLQTVFEVNLQLNAHTAREGAVGGSSSASPDEKPTLLFVLRDHVDGSLEKLAGVVEKSLATIWDRISKPAIFASSPLSDHFHLRFASLPHFSLQKAEFQSAVVDLRRWFVDDAHPKYLYRHVRPGNFRSIPLDGVPQYLDSCWASIKTNKDLDIPSQREMLARLRCGELAQILAADHQEAMDAALTKIKDGQFIKQVSRWAGDLEERAIAEFDKETKHYADAIVDEQRADLAAELEKASEATILAQCSALADALVRTCDGSVQRVIDSALTSALPRLGREWFEKLQAARSQPGDPADSQKKAAKAASAARQVAKFWGFVSAEVAAVTADLRKQLERGGGANADDADNEQSAALACLVGDTDAQERTLRQLHRGMQGRVKARLEGMTTDPSSAMLKVFERTLSTNEDGTTRFNTTITGLDKQYGPARAAALLLLACISVNRLDLNDSADAVAAADDAGSEALERQRYIAQLVSRWQKDAGHTEFEPHTDPKALIGRPTTTALPKEAAGDDAEETAARAAARHQFASLVALDEAAISRAYDMFDMKCDFHYKSERARIEAGTQSIPGWIYVVILFLGANEIWWLLVNPHMLILAGILAWFFFANWIKAQWQKFEETGPPAVVLPAKTALATVQLHYDRHVAPLIQGVGPGAPRTEEAIKKKTQ